MPDYEFSKRVSRFLGTKQAMVAIGQREGRVVNEREETLKSQVWCVEGMGSPAKLA